MQDFQDALRDLLNTCSKESESNTPDFVLAEYLARCLGAFNDAVNQRDTQAYSDVKPQE